MSLQSAAIPPPVEQVSHTAGTLQSFLRDLLQAHNGRKMVFSIVMVMALVLSAEGSVGPSTNTSFCTESKECLEYELVCKTDEYEVRHYGPTRWVSTDAEAYFMGVGAAMAFRRLFQYITGANNQGVQMEMTAPVLVRIPEETKMWEPAIYTLSFPLPAAYQHTPPLPTNDKLYFTEMPDIDVYVRSYGGWMLSVTSRLHAHLLTTELGRVQATYNHSYHYGAGYDSPLKLLNRHNEVWYVAEGEPVCTDPQEPTPAHTTTPFPTRRLEETPPTHMPADTPGNAPYPSPSQLFSSPPINSSHEPFNSSHEPFNSSHTPPGPSPLSYEASSASHAPSSSSDSPTLASHAPSSSSDSPTLANHAPSSAQGLVGQATDSSSHTLLSSASPSLDTGGWNGTAAAEADAH